MRSSPAKQLQIVIQDNDGAEHAFVLSPPTGKVTLDALVPLLQTICDNILAVQLRNTRISCAAGCAHCCYQLIPISTAEAIFLNKLLQALPNTRRQTIEHAFESIRSRSQAIMAMSNQNQLNSFDRSYFELGIPCPFLENNRCGIYQQRPLACREYHVDTPSQHCINPYKTNPRRAVKGLNIAALLSAFCSYLLHSHEKIIPLYAINNWGEKNPAAQMTFDAEWVLEKLMIGIVKAAASNELGIHWRILEEEKGQPPKPPAPPLNLSVQDTTSRSSPDEQTHARNSTGDPDRVLKPKDTAKLLTQHANAENVQRIVQKLLDLDNRLQAENPFIEIGAGDGYFRYLGSLCTAGNVRDFFGKLIETESDEAIVRNNTARGKTTLMLQAQALASHFGEGFTPLVISCNVLDVFSTSMLNDVLAAISTVLMAEGRVIHLMSSAIHPSIFADIAANNPGKTLLPFYSQGAIGVTLVESKLTLPPELAVFADRVDLLPLLFRQSAGEYLSLASQVQAWLTQYCLPHENLLLHDYSMNKICAAMENQGLVVEDKSIVSATVMTACDEVTKTLGNVNTISNTLGVLTMDRTEEVADQQVRQSSSFGLIVGRKTVVA